MHKLLFPDNLYNYHTADLMPTPFVWEGVSALQAARMLISSNKFVLFLVFLSNTPPTFITKLF